MQEQVNEKTAALSIKAAKITERLLAQAMRAFLKRAREPTLYQYDYRGLVTREINDAGDEILYVYDGNGNLMQKTDEDGYITTYTYDARNLAESINYTGGKAVNFAYDENGQLVEMVDWNGTTTFELDMLNRITEVTDHNNLTTGYTYDAFGNLASILYPDNTAVTYSYDQLGRLTSLTDAGLTTAYTYDAAGRLASQEYDNGWDEDYSYDAAGQLIGITRDGTLYQTTYDPQGNILTEETAGGYTSYAYDELNRLISANNDTYDYDSLGNITETVENGVITEYTYNSLNQQIAKTVDGVTTYANTFDGRGNLTQTEASGNIIAEYVYDATNRMTEGTNENDESSHYAYNGLGYLVGTTRDGITKNAVLDYTSTLNNAIMEYEDGNGLTYKHVYGLQKVSVIVGNETLYVHHDRIGSTEMLTDALTGNVRSSTEYDPWGSPLNTALFSIGGREIDLVRSYTGHSYDEVLGVYFAQLRMYDAQNKRFLAIDPVGSGLNWYAYVDGNPLLYIDPLGLWSNPFAAWWRGVKDIFSGNAGETIDWMFNEVGVEKAHDVGMDALRNGNAFEKSLAFFNEGPVAEFALDAGIGAIDGVVEGFLPSYESTWEPSYGIYFVGKLAGNTFDMYLGVQGGKLGFGGLMTVPVIGPGGVAFGTAVLTASGYVLINSGLALIDTFGDAVNYFSKPGYEKGQSFRGGTKSQRDQWYGYNDRDFHKWWEKVGKKNYGHDILDKQMADEVYQEWVDLGKPRIK